jgi:predicted AlkP superfamily phosphohydrolase/phosphomutase/Tfp pilus assembly protein PilF
MPKSPKVLLIGWDAADWKVIHPLMDAGEMPHLRKLVERGAIAQIATLHPPLSPMLWTSIATGKRPFHHGIHGFAEPTPDGTAVQPVSNLSRKCKALWNILNQNELRSIVVGWWPSHPAEPIDGVTVSDHFPKSGGTVEKPTPWPRGGVHPPELAETLAEFRIHPGEITGEMIELFVPKAREIDQDKDRRLSLIAKNLADCASVHGIATWLMDHQPWDFCAVYYDAIDHFCHGFMRHHPPRQSHIPERDFELYQHVVRAAYRFHDQMLGALLAKAGPDTRVILMSDHGFHPDHLRPRAIPRIPAGPAIEHRDFGILAMAGPGIKQDELIYGASLLDIAPTVLAMFDLPKGDDMDGKVLAVAFEDPPQTGSIPSWEDVPGRDGRHPPHTRLDPVAAQESLQQLVALGYIDKPDENREKAVADTVAELRYNLGEAYQDAGRHAEAAAIFRELYARNPDEQRHAVHLFVSCQALGLVDEMAAIVADLDGPRRERYREARGRAAEILRAARSRKSPLTEEEREEVNGLRTLLRFQPAVVDYVKAQLLAARKQWAQALDALGRIRQAHLVRPGLFLQTAALYQSLRQWDDAEAMYRKALDLDPDNPHAHIGICRAALRRRDYRAAAQSALYGLQRLYHHPVGHFLLGVALAGMGRYDRAADAFRAALSLYPNYRQAHLRLAYLLKRRLDDPAAAAEHFRLYRELRLRRPAAAPAITEAPAVIAASTDSAQNPPIEQDEVIVVSGLPRSGTSMLMQMLVAGGLDALTDGVRAPDEDNPRGYLEFEAVKQIHKESAWFDAARGKVVKVVAPLLRYIPEGVPCRVVFVDRHLDEILASQRRMLLRRGRPVDDAPAKTARLKAEYGRLILESAKALESRPHTRLLRIHRNSILTDPQDAARRINDFLGGSLKVEAMAAEVIPSLNRHRA